MSFIVFEGIDACGKATQSRLLAEALSAVRFEFPTYDTQPESVAGPLVGAHLKQEWSASWDTASAPGYSRDLDAAVFQCVQTINRYEMAPKINDLIARGAYVVADRYWPSGYVYGVNDGLDPDWLLRVHEWLPQPDAVILLDIEPKLSSARRPDRRDRYEAMGEEFYSRVANGYRELWRRMTLKPRNIKTKWLVMDGSRSVEHVHQTIRSSLYDLGVTHL